MRTTKRFSPKVLERFRKEGRGLGVFESYIPWHRVGRGDPASYGRSHLQQFEERQRELLSDQEWVVLFFCIMLQGLLDLREQFPLSLSDGPCELSEYRIDGAFHKFPGTLEIATRLGIRHPRTTGNGASADWVMTTDLLLALRSPQGDIELLAIAIKLAGELSSKRKKALLAIEREYWQSRGVSWLLITPDQYDERVGLTLRNTMPWALGEKSQPNELDVAETTAKNFAGHSLTHILNQILAVLGEMEKAQRAFWQCVWSGRITLDLCRGWRPHHPVMIVSKKTFLEFNPVVTRRSAWI